MLDTVVVGTELAHTRKLQGLRPLSRAALAALQPPASRSVGSRTRLHAFAPMIAMFVTCKLACLPAPSSQRPMNYGVGIGKQKTSIRTNLGLAAGKCCRA